MMCLGAFYIIQEAPFLGLVQIIVYTGAIMILFLFVLMLVGRDSSDSLVETLRGQRWAAAARRHRRSRCWSALALGRAFTDTTPADLGRPNADGGNVNAIAELLFTKYLFAFELTSALLIIAAVGAMVLAHIERDGPEARRQRSCPRADPLRPAAAAAGPGRVRHRRLDRHPGAAAGRLASRRKRRQLVDEPLTRTSCSGRAGCSRRSRAGRARSDAMNPTYYLVLSAALFTIGAVGVLVRRNAIVVFMCVELMLNAVNLTLVTFSRINGNLDGQVIAFFVMVVAAAEVVVGLAIIMSIFRTRRSASVDDANLLKY